MEKELVFSDTVSNKVKLADEYVIAGNFERSKELYESCLDGIYIDDSDLLLKLVKVSYLKKDYDDVIKFGQQILYENDFKKTEEKVALAWAFHEKGNDSEADKHFEEADIRFSNYSQRLEYAKYLEIKGKPDLAKEKLEELMNEIETMSSYEKKLKKPIYRLIKNYHSQFDV